eukprot:5531594-Pleurochrysis_carterae.AAC.1
MSLLAVSHIPCLRSLKRFEDLEVGNCPVAHRLLIRSRSRLRMTHWVLLAHSIHYRSTADISTRACTLFLHTLPPRCARARASTRASTHALRMRTGAFTQRLVLITGGHGRRRPVHDRQRSCPGTQRLGRLELLSRRYRHGDAHARLSFRDRLACALLSLHDGIASSGLQSACVTRGVRTKLLSAAPACAHSRALARRRSF